jgi:hypothetical protein
MVAPTADLRRRLADAPSDRIAGPAPAAPGGIRGFGQKLESFFSH